MDKKTVGVGALVALIVALGVTYFTSPGKEIVNTVKETVREIVQEKVGAFPGPEIMSDYLVINGIRHNYIRQSFIASSTPCAFQLSGGRNATTTTLAITVQGNTATSADFVWNIATSSTAFATTSPLARGSTFVSAGQRFSFDVSGATSSLVHASSTWVVVGASTRAEGGGYVPVSISGICQAETIDL